MDFHVDTKGKRFQWMGEVILPFIDQERLIKSVHTHYDSMSEDEKKRNLPGITYLYLEKDQSIGSVDD